MFIDVPDQLDLTEVRAKGKADDEELLPESASGSSAPAQPAFSEAVVEGLVAMGFSRNQAEHASVAVPGNNVEAATEWLIARLDDPCKCWGILPCSLTPSSFEWTRASQESWGS